MYIVPQIYVFILVHPWCQELGRLECGGAGKSTSATSNAPQTHLKRSSNAPQTLLKRSSNAPQTPKKMKKNIVEKSRFIYAYIPSYTSIYHIPPYTFIYLQIALYTFIYPHIHQNIEYWQNDGQHKTQKWS